MVTLVARYGYIRQDENPELWPTRGYIGSPLELLSWLPEKRNAAV
jgi:hypothetical protein